MWKERNPRRGAVCLLKRKKNLGSARTQGRLTGQQNQAQSPSSCEHDDNSQFKGKEWIEYSQECKCRLEQYKKTTVLWMTSPVSCDKGYHCRCSVAQSCLTLRPHRQLHARPPRPSPSPKVVSIASVMPSSHLILWCPLLLLPSIFPRTRDVSNESAVRIRRPKYWGFYFSISPSNEYSGLISLKIDWFDLLAVQGTFKSLLQHCSSKASILRCSEGAWCRDIKNFSEVITGEEQLPILIYPSIKKKQNTFLNFIVNISPCVYVLSSTNSDWTETDGRGSHIGSCAGKVGVCPCLSFCLATHLLARRPPALGLSPSPLGPASAFPLLVQVCVIYLQAVSFLLQDTTSSGLEAMKTDMGSDQSSRVPAFLSLSCLISISPSQLPVNFKLMMSVLLSRVQAFATPWTIDHKAPLSMEFSRQEWRWVTIPFSRGSSRPRDQTHVSWNSCIAGGVFTIWATKLMIRHKSTSYMPVR